MIHDQLEAITPELVTTIIPIGKGQEDFNVIEAALVAHPDHPSVATDKEGNYWNTMVLAFKLDEDQRQAIAEGADLYVSLLTFGAVMPGIIVQVDKDSPAAVYNVRTHDAK